LVLCEESGAAARTSSDHFNQGRISCPASKLLASSLRQWRGAVDFEISIEAPSPRNAFVAALVDASLCHVVRSVSASAFPYLLTLCAEVGQFWRSSSRAGELAIAIQIIKLNAQ
jgi:hypothetical protein